MNPDRQTDSTLLDDALVALHRRTEPAGPPSSLIERTIAAMNSTAAERAKPRHRRRNWILATSGIAAVLLVGIFISLMSFPERASAAELFAEAVREDAAYKGWVRIDISNDPTDGQITKYSNKSDGTKIEITTTSKGNKKIHLTRPSSREEWLYDGDANLIRAGTVNPTYLLRPTGSSIELESLLKDWGITETDNDVIFKMSSEDSLDRIDIDKTQKFHHPDPKNQNRYQWMENKIHLTVWIDPASKLVQKMTLRDASPQLREFRFTYGGDFRGDLDEFGAPKNVPIIDHRMTPEASNVLERLIRKHDRLLGDYVAIITTQEEWKSESNDIGDITLVSHSSDRQVSHSYQVLRNEDVNEGIAASELRGWPAPKFMSTLDALKKVQPWISTVRNTNQAEWSLMKHGGKRVRVDMNVGDVDPVFSHLRFELVERLCGLYGSAKLERVPSHEDWIAIRGEEIQQYQIDVKKDWSRRSSLRIIDPTRNDLTISYSEQQYYSDSPNPFYERTITFDSFVKEANGSWYPTAWKSSSIRRKDSGELSSHVSDSRLQVFPNETLDDSWFPNFDDYEPLTTQSTQK